MKHMVAELKGELLDLAVAQAVNATNSRDDVFSAADLLERSGATVLLWHGPGPLPFSTDWRYGGPIIEREQIMLKPFISRWEAFAVGPDRIVERLSADGSSGGPTALVAAMRAFVTARFGAEVELP